MDSVSIFKDKGPKLESNWRAIILFGKNTATYKFSLAQCLIDVAKTGETEIRLDELAEPYAQNICRHLKYSPSQTVSNSSKFLSACKDFNEGKISKGKLNELTLRYGFNYVLDAFHVVNRADVDRRFFVKDFSKVKKIILTDDFYRMTESEDFMNFYKETESRWNLVEKAWEYNISKHLIDYDMQQKKFFLNNKKRRVDVTSAKGALNGYQKGRCFYCFREIAVSDIIETSCDVDHFFPFVLNDSMPNINGVWNLVLACPECNRGVGGKFAFVPEIKYLERLNKRNEFLIGSHHPLRETLMCQTGNTPKERRSFLAQANEIAVNKLIHRWSTPEVCEPTF